mmetsp:Transcript_6100/g.5451  ORF Transcript_6100/g.5451 Transcript_6100/m.5451 type:complete len:85 (-) Transcript_6100:451-705(-)
MKQLLDQDITLEDLQDMEPEIYKGLKAIEETPDVEDLYLTFTYEKNFLGHKITKELVPDGSNIFVENSSKKQYIKAMCQEVMVD